MKFAVGAATDPTARPVTPGWRRWLTGGRDRWVGTLIAGAFAAAMLMPDPGPLAALRLATFDAYQTWLPRERRSAPAVIIAVDDASLARIGQWPWPRSIVARLIERVAARQPAAIGVDIIFAEPDRLSPERIADELHARNPAVADHLSKMQPNDAILADAIKRAPVVLGIAGINAVTAEGAPFAPARSVGPPAPLHRFTGALRSLPGIDRAAAGHGLLNAEPERGIVRRLPLVASIGNYPVLTLVLESLRVAAGEPLFTLKSAARGLTQIAIADLEVPTQADGSLWIHYTKHDPARYVSAADVLEGRDDPALIERKIALLGVTGVGLLDQQTTARGERMPGIEIHAQAIENIFDGALLSRPVWARAVETLAFALAAALVVFGVPRIPLRRSPVIARQSQPVSERRHLRRFLPRRSSAVPHQRQRVSERRRHRRILPRRPLFIPLAWSAVLAAAGVGAYFWGRLLFDPATPIAGITVLYGIMLSASLVATELQRRALAARIAADREAAARVAGELEAARRIQMGMLPTPEAVLKQDRRVGIFARMYPALEVGGDLYDFFLLPDDKLFVIAGDVSGKGLPAAMFMAVSKALAKSYALRTTGGLDILMTVFNAEISRENPEQLFVTAIALVIDLRTGELEYCNAGHEPPLLARSSGEILSINEGGGPPLCVMEDFPYEHARITLQPGDRLVLMSDGITEAMNRGGELYGRERLQTLLEAPHARGADAATLGNEILAAVTAFEAGADPADDKTLLLISWRGAATS